MLKYHFIFNLIYVRLLFINLLNVKIMSELKVKDKDHLVRDTYSGAILNTDENAFTKSRKIRQTSR